MTRIVAGVAKGRTLAIPPRGTRPTAERVREAILSAVGARMDLDGVSVLDLYAGSGALGLEAVSRGAARAVLVDSARLAARAAGTNAAALGLPARVIVARAAQAASIRQPEAPFALVFLDPPYETGDTEVETVLNALGEAGNLAPGAIIVLERAAGASPPAPPLGWMWERAKTYGDTVVHIACPDGTR